jgi:hypothetical protein
MAYHGMKKEDIEDTSMERHWKSARPAKAWNPFGQLPAPQRGGQDGEDDEGGEGDTRGKDEAVRLSSQIAAPPTVIAAQKIERRPVLV